MHIIQPTTLVDQAEFAGPLFFTAGPIQGGDDWQKRCCELLVQRAAAPVSIACPCRYKEGHPLYEYRVTGEEERFERQTPWERHYLTLASKVGCIIFWLPEESKTKPRKGNRPYACGSRDELGEWRGRLIYDRSIRLVIGAEARFPGLNPVVYSYREVCGNDFPIYSTLEETVQAAIAKAF
ncbi:MAG: hypothetical protein Q8Q05_01765 [bacterium]|nr:hypothetical protein [bacterium]